LSPGPTTEAERAEDALELLICLHSVLTIDDLVEIRNKSGMEEADSLSLKRGR
jgi:hypothetical protein